MNKLPVDPSGGLIQIGGVTTPNSSIVSGITGSLASPMDREWILQQLQLLSAPMGVQIIEDLSIQARMAVRLTNPLKPILLINPDMCFKKMKSTPIEMVIGLSHEMNHVREEARWRSTPQGQKEYTEHIAHLQSKGYLGQLYHTLYNCLRDVWVNAMTIQRYTTRRESLTGLYKYKLFKGNDFTRYPKHLQLCYTLLRESPLHVPDEVCIVDPEVRDIITLLHKQGVFEAATTLGGGKLNPFDNLGDRMKIIRQYIEPWFESLLNDDPKHHYKPPEPEGNQHTSPSGNQDGQGNGEPGEGDQTGSQIQPGDNDKTGDENNPGNGDKSGNDLGNQTGTGGSDDSTGGIMDKIGKLFGKKSGKKSGKNKTPGKGKKSGIKEGEVDTSGIGDKNNSGDDHTPGGGDQRLPEDENPPEDQHPGDQDKISDKPGKPETPGEGDQNPQENPWKDLLNDGQMDHGIEDSLNPEDFKKFVDALNAKAKQLKADELDPDKDLKEEARTRAKSQKEFENTSDDDPKLTEYITQLTDYLKFKRHHIDTVFDSDSGQPLIQSLVDVFSQIISDRTNDEPIGYDGPVSINDNPIGLDTDYLADGMSRFAGGNMNAKMFTTNKDESVTKIHVGVIDLYMIFDGSVSMDEENKLYFQKICGGAIAEAMDESNHNLQTLLGSTDKSLICNHSYHIFHGSTVHQLKSHSPDLTDNERIKMFQGLSQTSGSTGDFKAVDMVTQIYTGFQDKHKQDLKEGTRKSIMMIITDGGSDNTTELKKEIKKARQTGLITIGIGLGSDGKCVETNYASKNRIQGTGVHCPEPKTLPVVAIHALTPHLEIFL